MNVHLYLMKQTKPKQSQSSIQVINKPKVAYTRKSLQFFLKDKRKIVAAVIVIMIPFVENLWRVVPNNIQVSYYETLDIFVWTVSINLLIVLVGIAWMLCVPRKDHVMHWLSATIVAYGTYLTFNVLPFASDTPLWADVLASLAIFACLYFCLYYIQRNYLEKPDDYKVLHDGLVYDIHHQRFMGSINRIAGLLEVAEMEEPYKCLCREEIEDIKESIAYIAEKYEALK